MFIGHAAVALAAKPLLPRVNLAAALQWIVLFGIACLRAGKREALILGLLVFSHWVLDAATHRPDLPPWPGSSTLIGFGLWNSVPATMLVECAMFAAWAWWADRHRGASTQ